MAGHRKKVTPRQKMINLMYVVLMAMLALNVSSDVLNGFSLVDESLTRSTNNASSQNSATFAQMETAMKQNPEKVREWYEKAKYVKTKSDSIYQFAEDLKWKIVRKVDGDEADINNINGKEDLEAATQVMLAPGVGKGRELFNAINSYRNNVVKMVGDPAKRRIIADNLSTEVPKKGKNLGKNWQEYMFENTPVAAAVTLLTKLQNDVRTAEGEIMHELISNIDVKDVRVNEINAYVIPTAQTVVRGGRFSDRIIMAAVDTTSRPDIYIGNTLLKSSNGRYETICNSVGDFTLRGYMEMRNGDGETIRREFSQPYTVVEPTATVSATMMNMLYAGYQNPISVSVPGVPVNKINATMSGGSLTKKGDGSYVAVPTQVGSEVVITVTAENECRQQEMGKFPFKVRKLPDPSPFMEIKDAQGNINRYKGSAPLSKASLLATKGIGAAIDDGLLDIAFRVTGFETTFFDNMGNAVPEVSKSADFTDRQRAQFRNLTRGKRFYVSRVHAIGPDGIERVLSSTMEVIVN